MSKRNILFLFPSDRKIGLKAQKADAVLVVLGLLRQNAKNARRAAACLWVLKVFCSSGESDLRSVHFCLPKLSFLLMI